MIEIEAPEKARTVLREKDKWGFDKLTPAEIERHKKVLQSALPDYDYEPY